jgi:hypothetical protein
MYFIHGHSSMLVPKLEYCQIGRVEVAGAK